MIFQDDETMEGALYCPIILGADKTTVSVATGHVEYHPLYMSLGNIHNTVRWAHRNAVVPIGFLAIPKSKLFLSTQVHDSHINTHFLGDWKYDNNATLRKFKRQVYHASLTQILMPLHHGMTVPVVHHCPDCHYHCVIFDLAAFIADYPEQVYLSGVVQGWCPRLVTNISLEWHLY